MLRKFFGAILTTSFGFAAVAVANPLAGPLSEGDPGIKSIDTIAVASDGVLLISDGGNSRIVGIQTDDVKKLPGEGPAVKNIVKEIAGRLGAADKDVEIAEIDVNASTGRTYVLVKQLAEKKNLIVTVDPDGTIAPLSLKAVKHTAVALPKADAGAPRVTEMTWARDRVVCSARTSEEFASKLIVIPTPVGPEAAFGMISAETYHIAHGKWETKAPMAAMFAYEENGRRYIVGGFGCTPVVKYPIDAIQNGAKVKGESMIELGSGNRPLNMFGYVKDGKASVIINTFRFHHARAPLSPMPFWTCRFDQSILAAEKKNEQALKRNVKNPTDPAVTMVESFHGVMHMGKLDDARAVVVKDNDGQVDLQVLALP